MKVDILAIGIHPDDVELSCSGTLLKHADLGKSFGILDLSRGELGTRGNAELRRKEALKAGEILGAAFREQLDVPDGMFLVEPREWMKIIPVIRWCQPEIVLCNAPEDRHPDHGRASRLVLEACFYAGLARIETVWKDDKPQKKWRPRAVYHYVQDKHLEPDFVVDTTGYWDKKLEAIQAFSSQFYLPKQGEEGPQTPISGKQFIEYLDAQDKVFGRSIQADHAEGFIAARTPGVKDLFDLT